MTGTRLLLVDDEPQIARALSPALIAGGYSVDVAETGEGAIAALAADPSELMILDLGLPDMDGKEVIRRVREWSDVSIIVLSARDLETEKVEALDAGADEYVNKPVGVSELLARVRANLRGHERRLESQTAFTAGDVTIDFARRRVILGHDEVHLTPREFSLIRVLARHAGEVVTHKQAIAAVWGPRSDVDAQFVRVLVGQVRQKIEDEPAAPRLIITEPGLGYRMSLPEPRGASPDRH